MKLVECVPNFSEGRRPEVVSAIRNAIAAVKGVSVLDVSSDASHNRSVITFIAPVDTAVEAAFAGIKVAGQHIDLCKHSGEHPRIGAADVVPFIPLEGSTMEDCIALARALGEKVGRELKIPVYLYERAATTPARENLAEVRRGEFEGLREELGKNPARNPDFGPAKIHPTCGAIAIGARPFLVAYNVYLGPASNLHIAKSIAKAVRGSSGGFKYVKGLGLEVDGQAQVSMNLVDTEKTPLHLAFDFIKMQAEAQGAQVTWSEIVGLVPERVLFETAVSHLQLKQFTPAQVLERQVREVMSGGESVSGFLAAIASSNPVPGGGSVAAHAGALAAALTQMVTALTIGKKKYAPVDAEMKEAALRAAALGNQLAALVKRDAEAYARVSEAYKLPKEPAEAATRRSETVTSALLKAAEVPLDTARAAVEVAQLAALVAEKGNANAVTDAGVAALLAHAAAKGAAYNVRVNVQALDEKSKGQSLARDAEQLVKKAGELAERTTSIVERALSG
ncbi:MAG: glutamate formimidoyltransferase [Gemmatimonadetes bacterium]|nr:MAG: glutamate formimidoyltransferase [Gemmatimonadota bacterium]PYP51661.1 MAG: glutamate formimidoyltransferase [Gemmatimonadota bacterium]